MGQFVSAFDNVIIKRYDKNREERYRIEARYVYAPKRRVLHDLVNLAKTITVPVISVSVGSIQRDNERVFNKTDGYYISRVESPNVIPGASSQHIKVPVPVNIGVNMSIITRYQSDMDQILSNFIPYSNPYIIISWKVPNDLYNSETFGRNEEIRSEVLWSESINVNYPTDITAQDKYQIIADTSFTIKGWLFQSPQDAVGNIYKVDNKFTDNILNDTTFEILSGYDITETVSVSGVPQETNTDFNI